MPCKSCKYNTNEDPLFCWLFHHPVEPDHRCGRFKARNPWVHCCDCTHDPGFNHRCAVTGRFHATRRPRPCDGFERAPQMLGIIEAEQWLQRLDETTARRCRRKAESIDRQFGGQ